MGFGKTSLSVSILSTQIPMQLKTQLKIKEAQVNLGLHPGEGNGLAWLSLPGDRGGNGCLDRRDNGQKGIWQGKSNAGEGNDAAAWPYPVVVSSWRSYTLLCET